MEHPIRVHIEVPGIGNVLVTKHARERMPSYGVDDETLRDVLYNPETHDKHENGRIWREGRGLRLVIAPPSEQCDIPCLVTIHTTSTATLCPEHRKRRIAKQERARRQPLILTPYLPASFRQAVRQLREEKSGKPPSHPRTISPEVIAILGPRLKQVAELVNAGECASSIAATLKITHVSVKTHFKTINRRARELSAQVLSSSEPPQI